MDKYIADSQPKKSNVFLQENYASKNPEQVQKVKDVYAELKLKQVFLDFQQNSYEAIKLKISAFNHKNIPCSIFHKLLDTIYQRKK